MKNQNEKYAKIVSQAIQDLAKNPVALENFECYLSLHFNEWLEKFANTPEQFTYDLYAFSKIGGDETE